MQRELEADQKARSTNWLRMEKLRESIVKRGDPFHYVERGTMMLGWKRRIKRLPQ